MITRSQTDDLITRTKTSNNAESTTTTTHMQKIRAIKKAITNKDIEKLKKLAVEHGFINDKLRKKAWPLVLGIRTVPKIQNQQKSDHPPPPISPLPLQTAQPLKATQSSPTPSSIKPSIASLKIQTPKSKVQNSDFDDWLQQNDLTEVKQIFIDHDMDSLDKLSFYKANFGVFMIDKRLITNPMLIQKIITSIHELLQKRNISSPKISESKTAEINTNHANALSTDYEQIERDIQRSTLNYYIKEQEQKKSEAVLSNILHSVFDDNSDMHYVQGFNDVTSVIYAVCRNEQLAQKITQNVAETLFSDYILVKNDNDMLDVGLYKLIFDIIQCEDKELDKVLDNGHDFISISISWLLTWFAHHVKSKKVIARIYDFCLSSDKLMSSYLSAALIIDSKEELLSAVQDDGISIFEFFNDLQWEQQDFDKLILLAHGLYKRYSPYLRFKQYTSKHSKTEPLLSYDANKDERPIPVTPEAFMDFDSNYDPYGSIEYENHEEFGGITSRRPRSARFSARDSKTGRKIKFVANKIKGMKNKRKRTTDF